MPSFQGLPVYSHDEILWLKENPQKDEDFAKLYAAKREKMLHAKEFFSLRNEPQGSKRDLPEYAKNSLDKIYRILGVRGDDDGTSELPVNHNG